MSDSLDVAVARGRDDVEYWAKHFLGKQLHAGQLEWLNSAEASMNLLATANRWGKSFVISVRHLHRAFYKVGSEWKWLDENGEVDPAAFLETKYTTLHTAQGWDTVALVWEEMLGFIAAPSFASFVKAAPRSLPPYIQLTNGSKILFRTLGPQGQGVDGTSLYLITVDEAGWIGNLTSVTNNVLRIRTSDVGGMIDFIGTPKPGVSRDFYMYCKKASVYTKRKITFDFEAWLKERAKEAL